MTLCLIAAMGKNRELGQDLKIPWHIPEDLKYFRDTTRGCPVIMGRKTFESLGSKPLPGRRNIVISHVLSRESSPPQGFEVVGSFQDAIKLVQEETGLVFVVGGAGIYRESLPLVKRMYLTRIDATFDANIYFPEFDTTDFTLTSARSSKANGYDLEYQVWDRK